MLAEHVDAIAEQVNQAHEILTEIDVEHQGPSTRVPGEISNLSEEVCRKLRTAAFALEDLRKAVEEEPREVRCAAFGCNELAPETEMRKCDHCNRYVCPDHVRDDGKDGIICDDCREAEAEVRAEQIPNQSQSKSVA
jgi:hypothetical protein